MNSPILLIVILSFLHLTGNITIAQTKQTMSGTVKNGETGEALIGAAVVVKELSRVGVLSNSYGFYSLTLPPGTYTTFTRYLGFKTRVDTVVLDRDKIVNFDLLPQLIKFGEVLVSGERSNTNVTSTNLGVQNLEIKEIKTVPVLLGEKDILKTIQLLPGIKSAGEGSTGFYARGGATDQNLIVLDEAPVYNSSHLLGFLSVFNSDAVKDVKVITGGMPAEYGGRLSSVLDIRTNEGNSKEFGGSGGFGLLASRLTLEGPIVRDEGSFIISGRRTYADLFMKLSGDTLINRASLYFYDLNAKANYALGPKDRIFLSGYFGRDNFNYPGTFGFNWGNATGTARWNHIFGDNLFSNTSFIFSDYEYTNVVGAGTNEFQINSGIRDFDLKSDFQYFTESQNSLKFGFNAIYHTFMPGKVTAGSTSFTNSLTIENRYALESAGYISHELAILSGFKVNYGLRLSLFNLFGPAHLFTYDEYGDPVNMTVYTSGTVIKHYASLEPRISTAYVLNEENSLKASYTRTSQYLHLLSNSTTTNPSDLWVPSSNNVKPQYADQYAIGYFKNFNDNAFEASVELYYKNMQNLIDYKNGADLQLNPNVESLLIYGKGLSYGAEFLLRKREGVLSGWIGYTLSRTNSLRRLIRVFHSLPGRTEPTIYPLFLSTTIPTDGIFLQRGSITPVMPSHSRAAII